MLTIPLILVLVALALTIASALGRAPLWMAVFVLTITLLVITAR